MRILAAIAFWLLALPAAAQTIPVEAFGRLPAVADVALSPDGRRVAIASSNVAGEGSVIIVDLENAAQRQTYGVGGDMKLRGIGWADNERVTYVVSQAFHANSVLPDGFRWRGGSPGRVEYMRNGVINLNTGRAVILSTNPENAWADYGSQLIAPISSDPGYGRMIGRAANESAHIVLFRVALDSGRVAQDAPNGFNADTVDYLVDHRGDAIARFDSNRVSNRWRVFTYENEQPRLLFEGVSEYGQPVSLPGELPDGRLVALDTNEAGFYTLYAIDRADGEARVLFERPNAEVDGAILDPWSRQVVGATWTQTESQQHYFEPALQQVHESLPTLIPDSVAGIVSWSQDRRRFLIYAERGLDGGAYYIYDVGGQVRMLAARYPELARVNSGQRQSITYRARDGHSIPAYLTLPANVDPRNLPVVVLVHGGPHARDTMDFDWWATFLASRGYAVLQPNFRGSSGYGQAYEDAGRRQWGRLMQTDVEDGAAALVRAGIGDANRMCIVGGSYGGYAALAGATLTPTRYRCAVSVAGVSDLNQMLDDITRRFRSGASVIDWWTDSIGDRVEDRESIRAVSPINLVDQVQAPILLIHGTDDTVVPIDHSRRMDRALRAAGKNVRFVELRGDDHWLSDAPTRIQMLREIETFLAQNLAPAAP